MKSALALLTVLVLGSGCGPETSVDENQSAYKFAFSPCEESSPPNGNGQVEVIFATLGLPDGSVMKIRSANWTAVAPLSRRIHTVSSQVVSPYSANCWDHFPDQISESWVSDALNPPGTSGYWQGTYDTNRFVELYNSTWSYNNLTPATWVRLRAQTLVGGVWTEHRWVITDGYHWTQEY